VRRWLRLAVEIVFGLINPVLYLAILTPSLPGLRSDAGWWLALTTSAWILLTAFWTLRIFGATLDQRSRSVRAGVRTLLVAALACVLLYTVKDAWLLTGMDWSAARPFALALNVLRTCPLYFIAAILLWDYLRSMSTPSGQAIGKRHSLFLQPDRAARVGVAGVASVALVSVAFAAHRRSDGAARYEPIGDGCTLPAAARPSVIPTIPVPAEKHIVANRDWSLRGRPDILATLYQIGFAQSKRHGAPRSNAFGDRVRQVYEQRWLGELLDTTARPPG
jgi:hypothetical protein